MIPYAIINSFGDPMDQQNNSFFDGRTLTAIVLVALVWFGWQSYLAKKYPAVEKPPEAVTQTAPAAQDPKSATNTMVNAEVMNKSLTNTAEKLTDYQNSQTSFQISSHGMGIKGLTLKNQTNRDHQPMKVGLAEAGQFEVSLLGSAEPLDFVITQKGPELFEGVANSNGLEVKRTMEIDPETGAIKNQLSATGVGADFKGLVISVSDKALEGVKGGFLTPALEHQDFIVVHSGSEERINVSTSKEVIAKDFSAVSLAAIGNQYFTMAMIDKSQIVPEVKLSGGPGKADTLLQTIYKPTAGQNSLELSWITYSGAKSLANLEKIDKELAKVVDLGFFSAIGRVLLILLKWFFSITANWGVSIILLTLLVRTLVLPLNISTFRSTKKMQKLQPLIASIRERYKDDAQALNRETMALWKEHKVNPVGGCLPMLLQLPIFFALYRVLGQSIELYQAPFFGWIQDLSLKDPFYILPVLMGVAMFAQQKMTPTAMDPTQAKVMQFIPIIFSFMMISLPAGLTLYIFVNTLSGVLLQQLFMRDRSAIIPAKAAKA